MCVFGAFSDCRGLQVNWKHWPKLSNLGSDFRVAKNFNVMWGAFPNASVSCRTKVQPLPAQALRRVRGYFLAVT